MSDVIKPHRDEALRRIGRNVVNFQRLEASLRQLVPSLSLAGPVRELGTLRASRAKELKKKSLGELTNRLHAEVFRDEQEVLEPAIQTEITFAHSFRIEANSTEVADNVKALARLVRERNRLVHADLVSVDLNSITECEALSDRLDEQNERICAQLNFVNTLRQTHSTAVAALVKFINSEEFLEQLKPDRDDA